MMSGFECPAKEVSIDSKSKIQAIRTAGLMVLGCMDFRYCLNVKHRVREVQPEMFDLVAFAGCVHGLATLRAVPSPNVPFENMVEFYSSAKGIVAHSLRLAVDLHEITTVLLTTHAGCGHLGWEGHEFSTLEDEMAKHRRDRREAAEWIHERFPQLKVMTCFFSLNGENQVDIKDLCTEQF